MQILIYIIIGIAGGLFGGLGMGGGTLLIPLLVTFTGIPQHVVQTVNLIAFVPMALITLVIHIKNGLVKFKYLLTVSLPATAFCIGAAFLAKAVSGAWLGRGFGIFLILLGIYQLVCVILKWIKENAKKRIKS